MEKQGCTIPCQIITQTFGLFRKSLGCTRRIATWKRPFSRKLWVVLAEQPCGAGLFREKPGCCRPQQRGSSLFHGFRGISRLQQRQNGLLGTGVPRSLPSATQKWAEFRSPAPSRPAPCVTPRPTSHVPAPRPCPTCPLRVRRPTHVPPRVVHVLCAVLLAVLPTLCSDFFDFPQICATRPREVVFFWLKEGRQGDLRQRNAIDAGRPANVQR